MTLNSVINLRVDKQTKERLQKEAINQGMSLGDFVRRILEAHH